MSKFDETFKENIKQILEVPTWIPSRAVWEDTQEKASTKHVFGLINRYNMADGVPVGTLRPLAIKNCIDEMLWIYQKKSNNIHDLASHVWDQWADSNGSIGAAYGFQVRTKLQKVYETDKNGKLQQMFLDQMDTVLWKLKKTPFDRRIMIMLYSPGDDQLMGLPPCCYSCTFNVTLDASGNKVLNMLLNQRSQDMIVANNWNVFQYAVLLMMVAHDTGMIPGELVHAIADAHVYDKHEDIAKMLLERESYAQPLLLMNCANEDGSNKGFYDFRVDDFKLMNYQHGDAVKNIPVAV